MKTVVLRPITRSALAGAFAFLLVSVPATLGSGRGDRRDRKEVDPLVNTNHRDSRMAQLIREKLAQDSALSYEARNVKVTANHGSVLLKGSVANADEKIRVEQIARQAATTGLVENHLTIMKP